jgi:hypothetical protein
MESQSLKQTFAGRIFAGLITFGAALNTLVLIMACVIFGLLACSFSGLMGGMTAKEVNLP